MKPEPPHWDLIEDLLRRAVRVVDREPATAAKALNSAKQLIADHLDDEKHQTLDAELDDLLQQLGTEHPWLAV